MQLWRLRRPAVGGLEQSLEAGDPEEVTGVVLV